MLYQISVTGKLKNNIKTLSVNPIEDIFHIDELKELNEILLDFKHNEFLNIKNKLIHHFENWLKDRKPTSFFNAMIYYRYLNVLTMLKETEDSEIKIHIEPDEYNN